MQSLTLESHLTLIILKCQGKKKNKQKKVPFEHQSFNGCVLQSLDKALKLKLPCKQYKNAKLQWISE